MERLHKMEKRFLRYDFTAVEIHDMSVELANKNREVVSIEQQKKSAVSQFMAKINSAKADIDKLSNGVSSGYEIREVECDVFYHAPKQGFKTVKRKDSGEEMVEKMDSMDWNLWNQTMDEEQPLRDKGRESNGEEKVNGKRRRKKKEEEEEEEILEAEVVEVGQKALNGSRLLIEDGNDELPI